MKALLIAVLVVSAILFQVRNVQRLGFDGENTPDECETLNGLNNVRHGLPLYHDFAQPPHTVTSYPPLTYLVPGLVARWAGTELLNTFTVGRTYVYLSWLAVGLFVFALARNLGAGKREAALGALLWLSSGLAPENAIAFRPDAEALMLSLAGLWLYQRDRKFGAVAVLVAAFLHRHSAVAALIVIVVEELNERRIGTAALLAGTWFVVLGTIVAALQALTHGAFAVSVFGITAIGAGWPRVELLLELAAWRGLAAFTAGVIALVVVRGRPSRLLLRYFVVAFLIAFATSWKFGSGTNYYLEPFAAACVLAALLVSSTTVPAWLRLGWLATAIVATVPVLATRVQEPRVRNVQWDSCDASGSMLSEDGYLALRRDGAPFLLNASQLSALHDAGKFDDAGVVRRIEAGEFGVIVTTAPVEITGGFRHFPAHWLAAISAQYELARTCAGESRYVYLPRNRPAK